MSLTSGQWQFVKGTVLTLLRRANHDKVLINSWSTENKYQIKWWSTVEQQIFQICLFINCLSANIKDIVLVKPTWFVCLLFFRYTGMMTLWLTIDQLMINWCSTVDKLMINLWLTVSQLVINWWSTVDKLMINSWSADIKDMVVCFLFSSSNTQEWWSTVGRWMINYNRY